MPQMGFDMREGTVVRWLKSEGSEVKAGESIAEIETDKAVVEFESYAAGILLSILVPEGTTVDVGQPIAIVGDRSEAAAEPVAEEAEKSAEVAASTPLVTPPPADSVPAQAAAVTAAAAAAPAGQVLASPVARRLAKERGIDLSQVTGTGPEGRITPDDLLSSDSAGETAVVDAAREPVEETRFRGASPVARRLAEERGIDLAQVTGTGPGGRITRDDVLALDSAAEAAVGTAETPEKEAPVPSTTEAADGETPTLSRMRQQIARVTVKSKQEKPHFYISSEVDMTRAMDLRQEINQALEDEGVRVSVNDLIIKACVEALKSFPKFNAFYEDGAIRMNSEVNVGVAVAEEDGLIVPAIMDCGEMSLKEIAVASKDLAERSKSGTLRTQEYTGGTFAISNLGMFDVSSFAAIIHPPQTAVLAVGTVAKKPVVRGDDQIVVAQMMTATLSADHRIVDGAEGARFLVDVKRRLESPLGLWI